MGFGDWVKKQVEDASTSDLGGWLNDTANQVFPGHGVINPAPLLMQPFARALAGAAPYNGVDQARGPLSVFDPASHNNLMGFIAQELLPRFGSHVPPLYTDGGTLPGGPQIGPATRPFDGPTATAAANVPTPAPEEQIEISKVPADMIGMDTWELNRQRRINGPHWQPPKGFDAFAGPTDWTGVLSPAEKKRAYNPTTAVQFTLQKMGKSDAYADLTKDDLAGIRSDARDFIKEYKQENGRAPDASLVFKFLEGYLSGMLTGTGQDTGESSETKSDAETASDAAIDAAKTMTKQQNLAGR